MGLDLVELTIRIEDTFGIQIPDRIAPELTTPRQVKFFILSQVEESLAPLPCLSQKAFYSLRREFTRHLSLPRRQFLIDTPLKEIVPEGKRDEIWKTIGASLGAKKWPAITQPYWLGIISPRVRTVRELVDYLVANEVRILKGEETAWSRAQVRDVLKSVIIDETGVTDFSEDSRFVEDMHLD